MKSDYEREQFMKLAEDDARKRLEQCEPSAWHDAMTFAAIILLVGALIWASGKI